MAALMYPEFEPTPTPRLRLLADAPATADPTSDRAAAPPSAVDAATYRRRRLTVAVVAIVFSYGIWALAASAVGWFSGSAAGATVAQPEPAVHIVHPGETLWSIAAIIDDDADVRDTVDRLAELNGGVSLTPGQRLLLPAG